MILITGAFVATFGQAADREGTPERLNAGPAIQLYPNPATEQYIFVKLDVLEADNVKITVHNIIGNEMSVEKDIVDSHEVRVRVKDLASGYYLLTIKDDETQFRGTYKFLKK